jgi:oligoribonuclease
MSGLDPEKEFLLEIAVVVTGPDLTPRIDGPVLVIHQSDAVLDAMDAWNKGTHGRSGLIDKVKASTLDEAAAEQQLLEFIAKLEAYFHYRNLDVSTLKELAKRWKPSAYSAFKKQQAHTALADVHESIEELAHYRETFIRLTD